MQTRSRRSLNNPYPPPVQLSRQHANKRGSDGGSKRLHRLQEMEGETMRLLQDGFSALKESIWWRILPIDEDYDDLAFGMGLQWEDFLPLLLHSGFLYTEKRSTVNSYLLNHFSWQTFCFSFTAATRRSRRQDASLSRLNLGYFVNKKGLCSHFICRGRPIFSSPGKQLKAVAEGSFVFLDIRSGGNLKRRVAKHSRLLLSTYLMHRYNAGTDTIVLQRPRQVGHVDGDQTEGRREASIDAQEAETLYANTECAISFALALDLDRRPRMNREGTSVVAVHSRKQATETEKMMALFTAKRWGWKDPAIHCKKRKRIARAACRQVAYDYGYATELSSSMLPQWEGRLHVAIDTGLGTEVDPSSSLSSSSSPNPLSPRHCGKQSYCEMIETQHPGYLRELFRYAQRTKGAKATFKELADTMNLKSEIEGELRSTLSLHSLQVYKWFRQQGGKEHSAKEKPLDTDVHRRNRLQWVRTWWDLLTNASAPVAFLDEKWFYVTNRRRKIKRLPLGQGEAPGMDFIPSPKLLSRRFPVKAMFMGVVGNPIPERGFDGRIFLERISKDEVVTKKMSHQRFSDDRLVNHQIKTGDWRSLVTPQLEIPTQELATLIGNVYDLEEAIVDRLEFSYSTFVGTRGNKKSIVFTDHQPIRGLQRIDRDPSVPAVPVSIEEVCLRVRLQIGDTIERDCSCDSEYMVGAMDRVGRAVRDAYHWIPRDQPCYIVMDNAGGHGTNDTIEEYKQLLLDNYNIILIHQVPRSPYTNLLDLGVWCSLQALVEKEHYMKRTDVHALAKSVMHSWNIRGNIVGLDGVIGRVWKRLRNVLVLIVDGNGANDLVEKKRGKKFRNLDVDPEFLGQESAVTAADPAQQQRAGNITIFFDLAVEEDDEDDGELDDGADQI